MKSSKLNVSFTEAISLGYRNFVNFEGRSSRSEYWWFQIYFILGVSILYGIAIYSLYYESRYYMGYNRDLETTAQVFIILAIVFIGIHAIPLLAVTARRLHDVGRSGFYLLLYFLCPIGIIVIFIFTLLETNFSENKYGGVEGYDLPSDNSNSYSTAKAGNSINHQNNTNPTFVSEELEKLAELKEKGIITEVEFEIKKRQLLGI